MEFSLGMIFSLILVGVVVVFLGGRPCGATVNNRKYPKSAMEALLRSSTIDVERVVFYSRNPEWADLLAVANKNGLVDAEVICIHGAWILYRNTHYVTRSGWDYAVLSGSQLCTRWYHTKSMQPLGLMDDAFSPSVTFFTEPHMGSIGYTVNSRRGRKYFEYLGGSVKSLIVFGMSQWTVTDVKGKEYCLATNFDRAEAFPTCKLDDLTLSPVGAPWEIESITKGCPADVTKDRLIHLRDCEYFGRAASNVPGPAEIPGFPGDGPHVPSLSEKLGFLEPNGPGIRGGGGGGGPDSFVVWHWNWKHGGGIDSNDPEGYNLVAEEYDFLRSPPSTNPNPTPDPDGNNNNNNNNSTTESPIGPPGGPPSKKTPDPFENMKCPNAELKTYALMLAVRLNHDYLSMEQILWPARKEDVWKAELLDAAFQISFLLVPEQVVPRKYLLLVREFMMYHLTNYWKTVKTPAEPNYQEQSVMRDLALCTERLANTPPLFNQLNEEMLLDREPKPVFTELYRLHEMDVVIDTTYLLVNMVMGACHHIFDYTTNFWVHYIHVFMRLFLYPLVNDWAHFSKEDRSILGGYSYDSQHTRLILVTTAMLEMTSGLEPFDRPKALYDLIQGKPHLKK